MKNYYKKVSRLLKKESDYIDEFRETEHLSYVWIHRNKCKIYLQMKNSELNKWSVAIYDLSGNKICSTNDLKEFKKWAEVLNK